MVYRIVIRLGNEGDERLNSSLSASCFVIVLSLNVFICRRVGGGNRALLMGPSEHLPGDDLQA